MRVFCRVLEVWYSPFPPSAAQKPADNKENTVVHRKYITLLSCRDKSSFFSAHLALWSPPPQWQLLQAGWQRTSQQPSPLESLPFPSTATGTSMTSAQTCRSYSERRQWAPPGSAGYKQRAEGVSRSLDSVSLNACVVINKADLDTTCGFVGALADMEEPCVAGLTLTTLAAGPTQVDDQRLVLKQAHKMRRFSALSDTNLPRQEH